jgi:hypothetical protein
VRRRGIAGSDVSAAGPFVVLHEGVLQTGTSLMTRRFRTGILIVLVVFLSYLAYLVGSHRVKGRRLHRGGIVSVFMLQYVLE